MRALETEFDGHLFRSLLEARWAVFFKHLGLDYRYEHQGFDLAGEWYLPDFWFPKRDFWVEIKATFPDDAERGRCEKLATLTARPVFLTFGECWLPTLTEDVSGSLAYMPSGVVDGIVLVDEDSTYYWSECERCREVGLTFAGFSDRLRCGCELPQETGRSTVEGHSTPRLRSAYLNARRYRPGVDHKLLEALKRGPSGES